MARLRGADVKLAHLRSLRDEAITPSLIKDLRGMLGDKSNLVVAGIAEIAGTRGLTDLTLDLVAAFDRLMTDPETTDRGCRAVTAIVEALNKLEYDKPNVFLRGIQHVQEPIFATRNDMAGQLRGSCAFGLVRINHRNVVQLLADLLGDSDIKARTAAVQALGETSSPTAMPLLRFKARLGDEDPTVTAECLSAMIHIEPIESLSFVAEFLQSEDESVQEGAALALAETRSPEALAILQGAWPLAKESRLRDAVLLSISMLRLPAAIDFVVQVIADKNQDVAVAALSALAIHRHNPALLKRIGEVVKSCENPKLMAKFQRKFELSA